MFVNIYTHVFVAIDPICAVSLITVRRLRFHCCLQVRSGVLPASSLDRLRYLLIWQNDNA